METISYHSVPLPTNSLSTKIAQNFTDPDIKISTSTSKTIKDLIKKPQKLDKPDTCIYAIPCQVCPKIYVGETSRPIKMRIYEHRRSLKIDDHSNALTIHRNTVGHNFDLLNTHIIKNEQHKNRRKCIESALILQSNTITQRPGNSNICNLLARKIITELKLQTSDTSVK